MRPDSLDSLAGLNGKRAVVVGGGFGIGRAVVRMLSAQGVSVAIVDRDAARVAAEVAAVTAGGGTALGLRADVGSAETARGVVADAAAAFGGLDALVNIVGAGRAVDGLELTSEIQREAMSVNYLHHVDCAVAFARSCVERGRPGTVTAVSSLAGHVPFPHQAAYGAAKAALDSFVAAMAVEWGPHGIRVNAVAPGVVRTDRNDHAATADRLAAAVPLGRLAEQDEVAKAVLFLVSDLSSYLTGQTLLLDGGSSRYTKYW